MFDSLVNKIRKLLGKENYQNAYYNAYSWLDYYDNLNIFDSSLSSLANILSVPNTGSAMVSKKIFKPFDVPFETTLSEAIKLCGEPNYSIDNSVRIEGCNVIFYKKKIGNIKLTTQLHFFNDKLFLVKTDFSNTHSNSSIHGKITNLTLKKYLDSDITTPDKQVIVKDQNNNYLTIDLLSVNPFIVYVSGSQNLVSKILDIINTRKAERNQKEKLINDELFNKL
jgi:hypothetical protein